MMLAILVHASLPRRCASTLGDFSFSSICTQLRRPPMFGCTLVHQWFSRVIYVRSHESTACATAKAGSLATSAHAAKPVTIPSYLEKIYWWAYLHPNAVRIFERQWLVNLILWGNFARLRDAALQALTGSRQTVDGNVLQVACVYGDFSEHLAHRLSARAHLTVVDVAPIQVSNLQAKLKGRGQVTVLRQDATALRFADDSQDAVVAFFLLHEMPADVRRQTLAEALRVLKPGGRLVLVDYHRPRLSHPLRYVMWPVLKILEPFALDLWRAELVDWLPSGVRLSGVHKQTSFGGLYQNVTIDKAALDISPSPGDVDG